MMPDQPIKLIVGLGNPGPQHKRNRHNAGVIFLHHLCKVYGNSLRVDAKFFGEFSSIVIEGADIKLLFPTTFMNNSGKSVAAVCKFFKLAPKNLLVAYDEIDFDVGVTRFKEGGGHGGHNGVRNIIDAFAGKNDFFRLRIGVGHPGHKSMVASYVLNDPPRSEEDAIMSNIENAIRILPTAISGNWEEAMRVLHSN